jgi:hypothetical protein
MWKDPIIESLRETRAKMLAEAGGDIEEYVRRLQAVPLPNLTIQPKRQTPKSSEKSPLKR